jgi:hypothetical protein
MLSGTIKIERLGKILYKFVGTRKPNNLNRITKIGYG